MNDYEGALDEINKSIKIDQNNLNAYLLRGNIYKELKKFDFIKVPWEREINEVFLLIPDEFAALKQQVTFKFQKRIELFQ